MTTLNPAVARVLERLHYPLDVILMCVRWYVAYPLSLRHIEEMVVLWNRTIARSSDELGPCWDSKPFAVPGSFWPVSSLCT